MGEDRPAAEDAAGSRKYIIHFFEDPRIQKAMCIQIMDGLGLASLLD